MSSSRILIVDDDARVRDALRSLLSARSDWSICGEAADGVEAVKSAKRLHPDVILMDVSMPRMDGLKAAASIRHDVPESEIILVSQNDPVVVARQAQGVSVRGFVAKSNLVEELLPTIDRVFTDRREKREHPADQGAASLEPPRETGLEEEVKGRFGVLPNFFRLAPETPEITEKMWGYAKIAYLDNPLPALFKERLFVHLSRFCRVRYSIVRHVGFLAGLGHASGEANAPIQSAEEIVLLLRRQIPRGEDLARLLSVHGTGSAPLQDLPESGSDTEQALFAFASHVFLQTPDAFACLRALKTLLGDIRMQYLILLLAYVRSAHYWTQVHPELKMEQDIKELLATNEALAECISHDPEAAGTEVGGGILEGLPVLWKEAERATNLLAAIVDSSSDAIISKNLDGVITSWNKGAERMFGYNAKEGVGQHITLIVPADRLEEEAEILRRLRCGEMVDHFQTVRRRKDGTLLHVSLTISPVRDFSGRVIGASKVARDITEQKLVEENYRKLAESLEVEVRARTEQLRQQHARVVRNTEVLRSLSRRMLEIQDNERRHIARELHDSAGQTLTVLGISLARLRQELGKRNGQAAKFAAEAEELARQLSREIRTTSYLLHPPLLEERGLEAALNWYVRGLMERSGLDIELCIQEQFGRLSPDLELVIFRLVQECLTNIHRHSESKTALIEVHRQPGVVSLIVEDTGKGISPEKLAALQSDSAGVGIRGMRERVSQLGGQLEITSNGSGTRVAVSLPILTNPEAAPESRDSTLQPTGQSEANRLGR
jgi:PAS domain S-box-containing protein